MMIVGDQLPGRRVWTINGRFTAQQMTGVQRYAREIVCALDEILFDDDDLAKRLGFDLVMPRGAQYDLNLSRISAQKTHIGSGHAWDQFVLPWYQKVGVLSLGNFGPALARHHIVCIHDANTFLEPASYSLLFRAVYRTMLPLLGKRARKVATVSRFSADMLVRYNVCSPEKIFVAPNGHEHALRWDTSRAKSPILKALCRPYVLLLGSRAKHKNMQVVIEGADALDKAGIDIVVCGASSSIFSERSSDTLRPNIHYAGYVSDDDLAALYEGALCLAFPSKTEGFGIPILEAMARGCPVVSSNAASLLEVGGDAVLSIDPGNSADWRDAITGLCNNQHLRTSLIVKGHKRAELFSWRRSAHLYLDEILKVHKTQ
jgi:glycosyltransferase involved in cell wall biosynthesis